MHRRLFLFCAAVGLACAAPAATETPGPQIAAAPAAPRAAGRMAAEPLAQFAASLRADVEAGRIPGAVVLVARDGEVALFEAIGYRDRAAAEAGADAPMRKDTIFRIFSMTKPIVSVAAMMLVEEGRLRLSDPVARYIPEFAALKVAIEMAEPDGNFTVVLVPPAHAMTIEDLLRHTSGLTYGNVGASMVKRSYLDAKMLDGANTAEVLARFAALPLADHPGTVWDYGHSTDILGIIIERIAGEPLDVFLERRILKPLGMKDTRFQVAESERGRVAEAQLPLRLADVSQRPRFLAGGHGLVGTVADYYRFAQMLLNGGELDGVRLLKRETVADMTSDQLGALAAPPAPTPGAGYSFGLGFAVRTGASPVPGSIGDYYWSGWAGTSFWIDPKERVIGIMMLQAPERGYDCWVRMRTAVYSALAH